MCLFEWQREKQIFHLLVNSTNGRNCFGFFGVPNTDTGAWVLGLISQVYQKQAGLQVKKLILKPASIWDSTTAGRGLTCFGTAPPEETDFNQKESGIGHLWEQTQKKSGHKLTKTIYLHGYSISEWSHSYSKLARKQRCQDFSFSEITE